jgi:hypothetical protein
MAKDENVENYPQNDENNQEKHTDFSKIDVWSEYQRTKTEILDRYYNVNWFMPQYLHKRFFYSKNDLKLLSFWRDNLIRLFYLLEPHEEELKKISEFTEKELQDIDFLKQLTKKIFNLENIKKLTSYGLHEKEPIKTYKEENYQFFD